MDSRTLQGSIPPASSWDPYEVLRVLRAASDREIKTVYRKLALKYSDSDKTCCASVRVPKLLEDVQILFPPISS
jgi:preprotein translocase subunit Sec63